MNVDLGLPVSRMQRERRPDVERHTRRVKRQAMLEKTIRLPRHMWEGVFVDACIDGRVHGVAAQMLCQIYQEAYQHVRILKGESLVGWVFDHPIKDLAFPDMLPDRRQHGRTHLIKCLLHLESLSLIRRLESRPGRPVPYEVLLPSSEDVS
ncbi:hypothetical protein [Acidithiobacillus ferrivorans]|uniref:Uncharacterized protein n=1 Tax=Acidithiobacillus ferrivorans TaxID=160808 RepID=A0A7T4WCB3_9PROT|nr:hypothetical protein [Acidithiobacillus ferrivorans]QQD71984.1 hypothetical protein H2515_11175 [Acidithiobacillus ferrivorans]